MLAQILGMVLSGIISLLIAHLYYKKASEDLKIEAKNISRLNDELKNLIKDITELDIEINKDTDAIKEVVIRGTTYDPKYPYK